MGRFESVACFADSSEARERMACARLATQVNPSKPTVVSPSVAALALRPRVLGKLSPGGLGIQKKCLNRGTNPPSPLESIKACRTPTERPVRRPASGIGYPCCHASERDEDVKNCLNRGTNQPSPLESVNSCRTSSGRSPGREPRSPSGRTISARYEDQGSARRRAPSLLDGSWNRPLTS